MLGRIARRGCDRGSASTLPRLSFRHRIAATFRLQVTAQFCALNFSDYDDLQIILTAAIECVRMPGERCAVHGVFRPSADGIRKPINPARSADPLCGMRRVPGS